MAIIVDEGEKKTNIFGIIGWLVFLCIAGVAVYYVFFVQPQLVVIPSAGNLSAIAPITQVSLQPNAVIQNPAFQALTDTIPLPSPQGPAPVGRTNPFISP
jgi:hypothetical protein